MPAPSGRQVSTLSSDREQDQGETWPVRPHMRGARSSPRPPAWRVQRAGCAGRSSRPTIRASDPDGDAKARRAGDEPVLPARPGDAQAFEQPFTRPVTRRGRRRDPRSDRRDPRGRYGAARPAPPPATRRACGSARIDRQGQALIAAPAIADPEMLAARRSARPRRLAAAAQHEGEQARRAEEIARPSFVAGAVRAAPGAARARPGAAAQPARDLERRFPHAGVSRTASVRRPRRRARHRRARHAGRALRRSARSAASRRRRGDRAEHRIGMADDIFGAGEDRDVDARGDRREQQRRRPGIVEQRRDPLACAPRRSPERPAPRRSGCPGFRGTPPWSCSPISASMPAPIIGS